MSGPPAHIMIRLFQLMNHAIVAKRRAACFGDGGGARRELCATDERALVELLNVLTRGPVIIFRARTIDRVGSDRPRAPRRRARSSR